MNTSVKQATVYRMVTDNHFFPYGLKATHLLRREGFEVEDNLLTDRVSVDQFKQAQGVETTPQIYINGDRIGGYEDLRGYLNLKNKTKNGATYRPVIAIFCVAFLISCAISYLVYSQPFTVKTFPWFIAVSMIILGIQKLQDIDRFSTMFISYDLLAQRDDRYGYFYPFAETLAGILMLAGVVPWLAGSVALFIGTVGAVSVFKAVYIDKRELKCACVGGDSRVPLGFVSLTENIMMILMGSYTLYRLMA